METVHSVKTSWMIYLLVLGFLAQQVCGVEPPGGQRAPDAVQSGAHAEPPGPLDAMAAKSDLVFKGQVLSTTPISNPAFQITQMFVNATQLKVISVLKGDAATKLVVFEHYTSWTPGGHAWGGPSPPACFNFEVGKTYLVFAANLAKPDMFYSPSPEIVKYPPDQFRQLYSGGIMRTLDARPLDGLTIKDAHWFELNLLLNDANSDNTIYAIDKLDHMSLAGRDGDSWSREDIFKRHDVLEALLPLVTNNSEQVANRAMSCFVMDSNSISRLQPFAGALVKVANNALFASSRVVAIKALSGLNVGAVSNSLASLLNRPDENIRVSAVTFLPRFPREFAEQALRERARDPSASVRSVVADVIGAGKFEALLPTLAALLADRIGPLPVNEIKALPTEADPVANGMGDPHSSAARALLKFDSAQVAGILKTNVNDPAFHVDFVLNLAEKEPSPWLQELAGILESRIKHVEAHSKLAADDPEKYLDLTGDTVLTAEYAICWEDVRRCLLDSPKEKLSGAEMERYMDLLESAVQMSKPIQPDKVQLLYEFYRTKGLAQRAAAIRTKYAADGQSFDEFDRQHPDMGHSAQP